MNSFWIKTPSFIRLLFPNYIWKIKNKDNKIFLTFDDGPIPEITEWVLDILKKEDIKATFFCIGENIQKHPTLFHRILSEGHSVGNHTHNHLNGWKNNSKDYTTNFELCDEIMEAKNWEIVNEDLTSTIEKLELNHKQPKLFRPPYGKIKPTQSLFIRKKEHKIIMWDVLSYDFDSSVPPEECYTNVIKNVSSGSIIVFHDSLKAAINLQYALPKAIQFLKDKGYVFDVIR